MQRQHGKRHPDYREGDEDNRDKERKHTMTERAVLWGGE
jgi:hypothetical protein